MSTVESGFGTVLQENPDMSGLASGLPYGCTVLSSVNSNTTNYLVDYVVLPVSFGPFPASTFEPAGDDPGWYLEAR